PGAAVVSTANTNTLLLERAERERQRLLEALPDHAFEIARAAPPVPRRVIDTAEWLDLGGCGAELIPVGHAHTPGDLVVFEPETRTLITGDVVFNGPFPVLRDADSLGWIAALEFVLGLEPEHVVPGHGPVGDRSCIKRMRDLLELLRSTVAGLLDAGLEGEALINAVSLPERFDDLTRRERIRPAVAQIECEIAGQMRKADGGKEG